MKSSKHCRMCDRKIRAEYFICPHCRHDADATPANCTCTFCVERRTQQAAGPEGQRPWMGVVGQPRARAPGPEEK